MSLRLRYVCISVNSFTINDKKMVVMRSMYVYIRGPFEKFMDWRQCAAVLQREAVTLMPSCSRGVIFISLTVVTVWVTVVLKDPFLGWRSNCEGLLRSSWTGGSAPLFWRGKHDGALPLHHEPSKRPSYMQLLLLNFTVEYKAAAWRPRAICYC
jgi:hypothetical protein